MFGISGQEKCSDGTHRQINRQTDRPTNQPSKRRKLGFHEEVKLPIKSNNKCFSLVLSSRCNPAPTPAPPTTNIYPITSTTSIPSGFEKKKQTNLHYDDYEIKCICKSKR